MAVSWTHGAYPPWPQGGLAVFNSRWLVLLLAAGLALLTETALNLGEILKRSGCDYT